jgi:hypothetical protein
VVPLADDPAATPSTPTTPAEPAAKPKTKPLVQKAPVPAAKKDGSAPAKTKEKAEVLPWAAKAK